MESAHTSYTPPFDQLLTYGIAASIFPGDWPNYLTLGFGPEHVPALIRMATDEQLNHADSKSSEVWAPLHAWRTLGQLRAEAAIDPLLSFLEETKDESDWAIEELPEVLGLIGTAALPALATCLADLSYDDEMRENAVASIERIGICWPEARARCVEIVTNQLELFAEHGLELNTFLVSALVKLHAIEAAPLIERAFAAGSVDTTLMGDWDDVQVELGLLSVEELSQRRSRALPDFSSPSLAHKQVPTRGDLSRAGGQKKVKQKMAKQSRKKNRKR